MCRVGVFYTLTLGGFGIGWIMDCIRMHYLTKRENLKLDHDSTHYVNQ